MKQVRLYTMNGRYVVTVEVLPFGDGDRSFDVIVWGVRIFHRDPSGQYREAFAGFPLGRIYEVNVPNLPESFS